MQNAGNVALPEIRCMVNQDVHSLLQTCLAPQQDLEAIHDHISEFDCIANADHVLDQLMKVVQSLSRFPERGSYPKELVSLGIKEYRQTAFKPYRVIYRVLGKQVLIYLIADGRRDMQSVLARRLLGA
jgi:toxin ParE1/3/4